MRAKELRATRDELIRKVAAAKREVQRRK